MAGSPGRETEKKEKGGKKDLNLIRCFSSTRLGEGKVLVSLSVLKWQKICLARRTEEKKSVEKTFSEPTIPTQKNSEKIFRPFFSELRGKEEALTDFSHKSGAKKSWSGKNSPESRFVAVGPGRAESPPPSLPPSANDRGKEFPLFQVASLPLLTFFCGGE